MNRVKESACLGVRAVRSLCPREVGTCRLVLRFEKSVRAPAALPGCQRRVPLKALATSGGARREIVTRQARQFILFGRDKSL